MILIGQYDSPFVRRVGIALRLYGIDYEHRPWSTFGDAEKLAAFNPLRRVPTLVLDDGEVLVESGAILDHLDELVGPRRAMMPKRGADRRAALRVCALATGAADKAVSLLYERILRPETTKLWVDRCTAQIGQTFDALEADRARRTGAFWFGSKIGHADIAAACAIRFTREAHPALFDARTRPALSALAETCEAMEAFREISQPLIPPS